jgi:hypothetical protein
LPSTQHLKHLLQSKQYSGEEASFARYVNGDLQSLQFVGIGVGFGNVIIGNNGGDGVVTVVGVEAVVAYAARTFEGDACERFNGGLQQSLQR